MPYSTRRVDGYQVRNKSTGKVHAKSTTKAKAAAQTRLLRGVEHGMKPRTTTQAAGGHSHIGAKRAKKSRSSRSR